MTAKLKCLITLCFLANFVFADTINGCIANSVKLDVDGLVGGIYYYPWSNYMYGENTLDVYQTSYQEGGYAINANIVTENDGHFLLEPAKVANNVRITNFTYNYNPITTVEVWVEHPNFYTTDGTNPNVPITNYAFSVNGYVVPKVSGNYTFDLGFTDDVSFFSIGDGHTMFGCCQPPNQLFGVNSSKAQMYRLYQVSGTVITYTVNLIAGYAYPVNIWYANLVVGSDFSFTYTGPDGVTHEDWTGFAYKLDSSSVTTIPATGNSREVVKTVIYESIDILELDPYKYTISTRYSDYTGLVNNNISTISTTVGSAISNETVTSTSGIVTSGTDNKLTTSPIVIVNTPESTITTHWTGNGTVTATSDIVTNGANVTTSTITTSWTGTYIATTSDVVTNEADGKPTTSPIVIIETFTYRGWNSSSVTSSSASYTETETATCTDHSSQTILSTSSTTTDTTDIETASFTGTNSQPTSSTSVPTDFATPTDTDTETVSCSDENCHLPPSTSFTSTTIETSFVSGSSNSLSPVSSVAPSVENSSVILSTPALITTANENKAAFFEIGWFIYIVVAIYLICDMI
ncbi:hypothetical protein DAHU10_007370 [Hanseniaspora uvarum]|nr:hypothetical protein DAHU10_007370 [Hanseniaspora uvarum]